MPISGLTSGRLRQASLLILPLILVVATLSFQPVARAQEHSVADMHAGMSMPMDNPSDPARTAKLLADKRESEFNHHFAGLLILLAGIFLLAEGTIRERWPLVRYAWPLCFLLSGLFVLVWSDTELWPFGPQSWYFGLTHHPEVLQHKVFAILLLALGVIELERTRGALKSVWSGWVFPALGVIGSSMLFFHQHRAGMHGANHMEIMQRIQSEHFSFAISGFGIALSKGLSETRFAWKAFFAQLFPALLMVLGALLMVYVE